MREVRGDKDIQRSGWAWAAADTWRLVSVAWRMNRPPAPVDAARRAVRGRDAGLHPYVI